MNRARPLAHCVLRRDQRRLEVLGQPVELGDRAFDLFCALFDRCGELVTSRELVQQVWPTTVVTTASLRALVMELRKALATVSPALAQAIRNIHGRGYLLLDPTDAPASDADADADAEPVPRPGQLATAGATSGAAPRPIGRDEVVQQIGRLLAEHRIVSLVAPGGMGKTTVARSCAGGGAGPGHPVTWVDLSTVDDDQQVADAVARAASCARSSDPIAGLVRLWRAQDRLLVLDCCERAVSGAASLAERLVQELPQLRILATSRQALHAEGERVLRLPPLDCEAHSAADPARPGAAVALFLDRAQAAGHVLQSPADLTLVSSLCRKLDGLPLAIELAAAHLVAFGLRDLVALLGTGFQLTDLGLRNAPGRHKTLEATFHWSYGLLDEVDRQVLEWLAVFEGGASLRAVLEVLAASGLAPRQIAEAVARLADRSLLKLVPQGASVAYLLLDTTRAFAAERLQARGAATAARQSHARHLLAALTASRAEGEGGWAVEWFGAACPNLANLRAALDWSLSEPGVADLAIRLSAAAAPTLLQLSLLDECERSAARALALMAQSGLENHEARTRLLAYAGAAMLGTRGPADESLAALQEAQQRAERSGDAASQALALSGLFWLWIYRSEPRQAMAAARALHDSGSRDAAQRLLRDQCLAFASTLLGDQREAAALLADTERRNLRLAHGRYMRIGSDPGVFARVFTVKTLWLSGALQRARELFDATLPALRQPEHGLYLCWALNEVAVPMACFLGDWQAARAAADELSRVAATQSMSLRVQSSNCTGLAIDLLCGQGELQAYLDALDELRAIQFATLLPWWDGVAAEVALRHGNPALALHLLDRALAECQRTDSLWWAAELHRLRGLCLLASDVAEQRLQGTAELRQAIALARAQGAAALELCAAISLADGDLGPDSRGPLEQVLARTPELQHSPWARSAQRLLGHGDPAPAKAKTKAGRRS